MESFSHLNNKGEAHMVDVSHKSNTIRMAIAEGSVFFTQEMQALLNENNWNTAKGSVVETAKLAGTLAAKQTSQLIPLCHPLPIHSISFHSTVSDGRIHITCEVKTEGKTGVEMEALTGVSVACLTIYDMCKALGHTMELGEIRLVSKSGGKHNYQRP